MSLFIPTVLLCILTVLPALATPRTCDWLNDDVAPFPLASLKLSAASESQTQERDAFLADRLIWEPLNWKINSDATSELQNEQQVIVNPIDHDNLVAVWRDFRLGHRRVGVGYSFDGGITWHDSLLEEPSYPRHSDPGLTCDRLGNIYVVILSYTGSTSDPNGLFVLKSTDGGVTWDDAVEVIDGVPSVFEDKELIACDRSGGTHDGNLYVTWARFGMDTDILSARSTDGASSFDAPAQVSDTDGVQWPVPAVGPDGTVYVAWANYSPASIRLDRSYDGGATFGTDVTVTTTYTAQTYVDGPVLVFSYPAMDCDITDGLFDGRLYIAYMDRGDGDQDIFLRYSDDGGTTWSSPLRVNDDAYGNGADQFHPWLVVSEDGVVNVVFYDRRNDPGNLLMDVYVAQSFDGGASFESNVRVTTVSSDPTAGSVRAGLIGEYIGLAAASSERLHPVWTDTREGNQDTYTAIVDTTFVDVAELPPITSLRLSPPYPNPFRDGVEIAFHAPHAHLITCRIVDVAGREVTRLSTTPSDDGTGTLSWDGADDRGSPVSSGVYFLKATSAGTSETLKLILLH